MTQNTESPKKETATLVTINGPETIRNGKKGDIPVWNVIVMAGLTKLSKYACHTYKKAETLASDIARDRKVQLLDKALPF